MTKRPGEDERPSDDASSTAAGEPSSAARSTMAIEAFADRLAGFVIRNRVWIIVLALIVAAGCGYSLRYATTSADARVFFGKDNPELVALKDLESTYTRSNNVFFVITDKSGDIFKAEDLKALAQMTDDVWKTPFVLRVDSLANFQTIHSAGDDITVAPLYKADESLTPERLAAIKKETLSENELVNSMVSADGSVTGISMLAVLPQDNPDAIPTVAKYARDLADKWRARWPFLEVRLTGGIMADMTFAEAGDRDERTLIPIMAVLLFGALAIGLRSVRVTVMVGVVIACTVFSGLGTAVWFGSAINAGTASSPIAIMVLTVASSVHLLLGWIQAASGGLSSRDAIRESVKVNLAPVTATSITTVIGFLTLNFSDSPPLRELGNIVAVGTLFTWLFCLTLLPALISYLPPARPTILDAAMRFFDRIGGFVTAHPRQLILLFIVLTAFLGFGATRIVLDDNYIRYFSDSFEFRRDTDYVEKHLSGLNAIEYSLNSGVQGGVFDPAFLKKVDRFSEWLRSQPGVTFVDSLPALVKRLNQAVNGGGADEYRLGDTRAENAQNFLLYELSLPVGQELTNSIDIDRAKTLVTVIVKGGSSRDIRHLANAGEQWLKQNAPEIAAPASGLSVVFAYVSERNIKGMITGTLIGLLVVSLIMLFAFQSVKFGLLSLVPNLVPGLQAFGVWGLMVGDVNLAATVVTSMTFGIIVDDTIHFTMKYLRARRVLGESPEMAVRHTLARVGFPVLLTSIAIGSGFAVIATSGFQLSQYLGGLTVLIIGFALVADVFLLLPLLLMAERLKR